MKNKELFENLERELANRAREYKDKTITMLNTPSKNATITKSPIIHSPQTQSPAKQPRLFLTPNYE